MIPVTLSLAQEPQFEAIRQFYVSEGYNAKLLPHEKIICLIEQGIVIGACRLNKEEGAFVLRGLYIHKDHRRKGLGTRLVNRVIEELGTEPCYCLPHYSSEEFYESVGFIRIPPDQSPRHLRERYLMYIDQGLKVVMMKRKPTYTPRREVS
jgi:N-acetylglutamate synthase-like GNAT family acetyltransferase